MMYTAQQKDIHGWSIRYPRGIGSMIDCRKPFKTIEVGTGKTLREGNDIAILSIGPIGIHAAEAAEKLAEDGVSVAHYDMRFAKPLDTSLLSQIRKQFKTILTIEDGAIQGGFGSAVLEWLNDNNFSTRVIRLGIPDRFIDHGTPQELYRECGIDTEGIYKSIKNIAKPKLIGKVV